MTPSGTGLSVFLFVFVAVFAGFHLFAERRWIAPSERTTKIVRHVGFAVLVVVSIYGLVSILRG